MCCLEFPQRWQEATVILINKFSSYLANEKSKTCSRILGLAMGTFFASSSSLALAQSSVTIFGVVDVGVTVAKSGSNRLNALNSSQGKTSLLGLRGTEDLGGGNRAQLWLEGGLNPDVGSGGSSGSLASSAAPRSG